MKTLLISSRVVGAVLLVTAAACVDHETLTGPPTTRPAADAGGSADLTSPPSQTQPDAGPIAQPVLSYPGHGFVVHEWGTNTVVVGSDGSLQRGLHHEEEDLPSFVYDRMRAGSLPGSTSIAYEKMETPILYFYSDQAVSANVAVNFPNGVFTQWYPAVKSFYPFILNAPTHGLSDPVLNPHFMFLSQACHDQYGKLAAGLLDWSAVQVQPRSVDMSSTFPDAPLDRYSWSYARQVASNSITVAGVPGATTAQNERFLFYRGLGNFPLPVKVTVGAKGGLVLANSDAHAMGSVFVLNVNASTGSFTETPTGIAPGATLPSGIPSSGTQPLDAYVAALATAVTGALDRTGLYHDEAVAMVNTWKRQWFRTPGARVLYLAPQAWTETLIPLQLSPAPDSLVRVMMIRVEVLPPELEAADVAQARLLAQNSTAAQAYFTALGRFAEPRLRRALTLLGNPSYAQAFLATIVSANTVAAVGE